MISSEAYKFPGLHIAAVPIEGTIIYLGTYSKDYSIVVTYNEDYGILGTYSKKCSILGPMCALFVT